MSKRLDIIHKSIAFAFLLLFTAMQALQAFHVHTTDVDSDLSHYAYKATSKIQLVKGHAKCHICDFNHHRQQDFATNIKAVNFDCLVTELRSLNVYFSQQIFEASVHTWTNKGPPASFRA